MAPVRKTKLNETKKQSDRKQHIKDALVISGQLVKKVEKQHTKKSQERGVLIIRSLPHGFFEQQLKGYFEQFGHVTRLRLARSKRTGGSKGYAFVEFEYPEIAQVAAETMNNYLMFNKLVKASYIPPDQQQYNYFKTSVQKVQTKTGKEIYVSNKTRAINKHVAKNNNWSEENFQKRAKANLKKLEMLSKKYAHLGIDFTKIAMNSSLNDERYEVDVCMHETPVLSKQSQVQVERKGEQAQKGAPTKKKSNKSLQLEDLLGDTINDDSNDDDYEIADTSDEGTYGFGEDNDSEIDEKSEDDESDEETATIIKKKAKALRTSRSTNKPKSKSHVDRLDDIVKRKPQTGGIKKRVSKKTARRKESLTAKGNNLLKLDTAKKIAQPLKQINKTTKTVRTQKV